MAAEARKAVIKNGDMADNLQQDAVDSALAVSPFEHARNPGLFQDQQSIFVQILQRVLSATILVRSLAALKSR